RFRSFVDEKALKDEIEQAGLIRGLNNYIKVAVPKWETRQLNVAVSGGSGTGKSSLINALRNISDDDECAASVGVVETTHEVKEYSYEESNSVKLYDLPGAGTSTFPKLEYLDKVCITQFDVVIIVCATRFLENDVWLAEQCLALDQNVLFVRTKIDIDIMNEKRKSDFNEENCLQSIKKDTERLIKAETIKAEGCKFFLVSCVEKTKYEFKKLNEVLVNLLSNRGVVIAGCIEEMLKESIIAKEIRHKEGYFGRKIASSLIGFLPIPFLESLLDPLSISKIREYCMEDFGINTHLLEELLDDKVITSKDMESMRTYKNKDGDTLYETAEEKLTFLQKYSKYVFPVFGSVYSAFKSYRNMKECVNEVTNDTIEDEKFLVKKMLQLLKESLKPIHK
ncbi:T-cell-specific guanine nucleotide triphosphate-binding protein 2-like, partial [Mercenaria mercenaria]|uniref:T-cell-specific guanine nucleotide triphosphate-binding protein 2-like n=1 Tax=Mercenaria mercenaria TaxID=6596 RepID=UPI00234F0D86